MPRPLSALESLPSELLDEIIFYLSGSSPSLANFHQPPNPRMVRHGTRDLKNLARVSLRLREVVLPSLYAHACFNLGDIDDFLAFVTSFNLKQYVSSIVVKGKDTPGERDDPLWWRRVLSHLDPLRVTVIAPPRFIGAMLDTPIMEGHSWAFEVPLQVLQLERDSRERDPMLSSQIEEPSSLLDTRSWSSLSFNESSSLKAYNHYEYFLFQVPSLIREWGSIAATPSCPEQLLLSLSLNNLTSFQYTAVFPFYNHVKLVLNAVSLMTSLRTLRVQLAPSRNDKAIELEQRGSMDPSDPWMELATGYSLIAQAVRDLADVGRLVTFSSGDYDFDALRSELAPILYDVLNDHEWLHDGHGTWVRKKVAPMGIATDPITAVDTVV
ncbi:hypothetical protein BDW42DRAFT_174494 [Aspergillus taichungensis]|uniref:F-box domain-containing protein n=1 Tax=Aspergillus taichungensis TaxID=482145 RepID=A0A2J5HN93_9EURO|nr:hypothetical protein BDW42DRAFT_174494 [Aspergillus taichungensis]